MSEPARTPTREDINEELDSLERHGYGTLLIAVHKHKIVEIAVTTRQRESRRAGQKPAE